MRNLRGYKKRYFKLAIIAMYSTLWKLSKIEINMLYHKKAYLYKLPARDPPTDNR
jgi:hypothetical protein